MKKVVVDSVKVMHHNRKIDGMIYMPEDSGIYPVVIFSHGYNGHKSDFDYTARYLAQNGICAFCFTFCGGSTRDTSGMPTTDMTLFTEREDLLAVISYVKELEFINENQMFVFGGSQGGLVTALTVDVVPDMIRGMILLYPAFCIADDWNKRFPDVSHIPEELEFWDMKLGKIFFESINGFDVFTHVGRFKGPVFIIHGAKDPIVSMSYIERVSKAYINTRLEIFTEEGHGFTEEGTRRMTQLLHEFIADVLQKGERHE